MATRKPVFLDADGFPEEMNPADDMALGGLAMSGNITMAGNQVTGLGAPSADGDAATKAYADGLIAQLDRKASVRLATAAALPANTASGSGVGKTLTADANGALSVDGVAVVAGDRILVKDETAGADVDHGIYEVTQAGDAGNPFILTRSTDADADAEVTAGMFTVAAEGTANADTGWLLITNDPIVVDTTALEFSYYPVGSLLNANAGLVKSGNDVDVELDTAADAQGTGADGGSSGLEFDVSGAAGKLRVKVDPANGIQRLAGGLGLELDPAGALSVGASGASVNVDGTTIQINGSNQLEALGATEAERLACDFTSADALTIGDPVFKNAVNDEAQQADANIDAEAKGIFGIAAASVGAAATVEIIKAGIAPGVLAGATAGDIYYADTPSGLTTTKPSGSGNKIVVMGQAKNATDLIVDIEYQGKLA